LKPVSKKNIGQPTLAHNFAKCWSIFNFSPSDSEVNASPTEIVTKDPTKPQHVATLPCEINYPETSDNLKQISCLTINFNFIY